MRKARGILQFVAWTLVVAFATWIVAKRTYAPPSSVEPNGSTQELTAAELLQHARHLLGSLDSSTDSETAEERADLMLDLAARRQAEHPNEIPAAWSQFKQLVTDLPRAASKDGTDAGLRHVHDRLVLMLRYVTDLDDAALACRCLEDLEVLWRIEGELAQKIRQCRSDLLDHLQQRLDEIAGKALDAPAALKEFAVAQESLQGPLVTLVATVDSAGDNDEGLERMLDVAGQYKKRAMHAVDELEVKAVELEKQLHDPHYRHEPNAPDPSVAAQSGPISELLNDLRQLEEVIVAADLESWNRIHEQLRIPAARQVGTADGVGQSDTAETVEGKIADVAQKIHGLQYLAYNLWALRQIQMAEEDAHNWDVRLSQIDVGLLHPTVASLYSNAYAEQIESVEEPLNRAAKAQHVLVTQKLELDAF